MTYLQRATQTKGRLGLSVVSAICVSTLFAGCSEPTRVRDVSTFTADLSGSTTGRLTGSATASSGGDWARESVVQVTLPNGGTFSGIVLAATGGTNTISIIRSGTELQAGTFRLGRVVTSTPSLPSGGYTAGYVVRRATSLQLFIADSGTVTIVESGSRVSGSFTLYLDSYDVIPIPTPEMVGKPITPLEHGKSPLTISGSFTAARR